MAPLKSGAVFPAGAFFCDVLIDWVICCEPPEVLKLKTVAPSAGYRGGRVGPHGFCRLVLVQSDQVL
ncbi:MAG: hypothetical protein QGG42_22090 [Phycisphaerae bacterium]|nr:hypothetical protein [Phycisphaerae bacterium]